MRNRNLGNARKAKNDEFYTQYVDIEKEMNAYLEFNPDVFKDAIVFLPCDDPEWSNFTKYFAQRFEELGLKKLISTSYAPVSKPEGIPYQPTLFELDSPVFDEGKTHEKGKIFTLSRDLTGDKVINVDDLEWSYLEGDGDFRSDEVTALRNEATHIVTNPPFSLFRTFVSWLIDSDKYFSVIGNMNAIAYKEIFPLIRENKTWLGATRNGVGSMYFYVFDGAPLKTGQIVDEEGRKLQTIGSSAWFTNIEHGKRHEPLALMSMDDNLKFNKAIRGIGYQKYDNYDAIEVPRVDAIPGDYEGVMGVPISFLGKYNPEQFEIVGTSANGLIDPEYKLTEGLAAKFVEDYYAAGGTGAYRAGNPTAGIYRDGIASMVYQRLFIRHKRGSK